MFRNSVPEFPHFGISTPSISLMIKILKDHVKSKFQYFLNQYSNVYLEEDEHQALRTR